MYLTNTIFRCHRARDKRPRLQMTIGIAKNFHLCRIREILFKNDASSIMPCLAIPRHDRFDMADTHGIAKTLHIIEIGFIDFRCFIDYAREHAYISTI